MPTRQAFTLVTIVAVTCLSQSAQAQHHYPYQAYWVAPPHYHASTAWESHARGRAAMMRAHGQHQLASSQALLNVEEARRLAAENRVAETAAYFEMRRINQEARQAERAARMSEYPPAKRRVVEAVPDQPEESLEGLIAEEIVWPAVLQERRFADDCRTIDLVLAAAHTPGGLTEANRDHVKQLTLAMRDHLKEHVKQYTLSEYMAAKRFLEDLSRAVSG